MTLICTEKANGSNGLAMTALTGMLDRMESAKLIYRDRGDKYRQKNLIFLT